MKKLERQEMKNLKGGMNESCSASLDCPGGGTVSCTGPTGCHLTYTSVPVGNGHYQSVPDGVDCGSGGTACCGD